MNFEEDYLLLSQSLNNKFLDCCTSSNVDDVVFNGVKREISNKELITNLIRYPNFGYPEINDKLKKIFSDTNFLVGSGSEELIVRINNFFRLIKKNFIIVKPIFYRVYSNIDKCEFIEYDNLFKKEFSENDVCWINNPNSLNGSFLDKEKLIKLFKKFPKTIFLIDETNIFYLENWKEKTLFKEIKYNSNLIVISSLSKFFGLPGLRFGFASLSNDLFKKIENISCTFPISSMTVSVALYILENIQIGIGICKRITKNKKQIIKVLNSIKDIEILSSSLNFIWCKSKSNQDLYKKFLNKGILTFKENKKIIRITIHSSQKLNKKFINKFYETK